MNILLSLCLLLSCNQGCGGSEEPTMPEYTKSGETSALQSQLTTKSTDLLNMSYEDWLKRFSPSAESSALSQGALDKYKGLFDTQDYSLTDYTNTENQYLDTLLKKYGESRKEAYQPLQESLLAENLMGSGPGYDIMSKYGKETAEGAGDITKTWAYEGIQRQQQQQQYMDALKRGDYSTMYNLALSEENKGIQAATTATNAEMNAMNPAMSLWSGMTQEDLAKYQAAMQGYQYEQSKPKSNFGGIGTGLGMLAGYALAPATGGASLIPAMIGGSIGGGLGSMFQY